MAHSMMVNIIILETFTISERDYICGCTICSYGSCSSKLPVCSYCRSEYVYIFRLMSNLSSDISKIKEVIINDMIERSIQMR